MATPITAESTRLEMFKWLATETDNDLIVEVAAFVKKHTFKKREEDFFKPMTEQELTEKIMKARNSAAEGKGYTTAEMRERAKTWGRWEFYWTIDAEKDLIETFDYLKIKHNKAFADKVIDKIFDKTFLLENFPEMGTIQKNQMPEGLKVRYLVEGNYKILYQINASQGLIEILAVFDTRQDPSKMLSKEE